ncbi:hypothetical protein JCM11641_001894 [Rhodosporidiobolus odoratus]
MLMTGWLRTYQIAVVWAPYTASNCPLFNPSFSTADVLAASTSDAIVASPPLRPPEPRRPSLVDSLRNDRSQLLSVSPASPSATGADGVPQPPVSYFYTDYSIAPSPVTSSGSLAGYNFHPSPSAFENPTIGSQRPLPCSSNDTARRAAIGNGMTVSSAYSGSTCPSPGTLLNQSVSYERRRQSLEEESSFSALGLPGEARDASIAYELSRLGGHDSVPGQTLFPPLPPRRPSYNSLNPEAAISAGREASRYPLAVAVTEESPELLDEDGDMGYDEEDDEADGDYIEGAARKPRRSSAGGTNGGEVDNKPPISSSHVVPHVSADSVTPFISKLYHLLSNPIYSDVVRWSGDGKSVLYVHTSQRLLDLLSRFFRHSSLSSFSRQMNIYGFTRLSIGELLTTLEHSPAAPEAAEPGVTAASEYSGFTHPHFSRDGHAQLNLLKPSGPKTEKGKANLAKKMAEGGRKRRGKSSGKGGDKPGGVRKGKVKE